MPDISEANRVELRKLIDGVLQSRIRAPIYGLGSEPGWPREEEGESTFAQVRGVARITGLTTPEAIRQYLDKPLDSLTRRDAVLHTVLGDTSTAAMVWKRLLLEDPTDLEAASSYALSGELIDSYVGTLGVLSKVDPSKLVFKTKPWEPTSVAYFEVWRAMLAMHAGDLRETLRRCDAAQRIEPNRAGRRRAIALLGLGQLKEGLEQAERALRVPGADERPDTYFTLGLAYRLNGRESDAIETWKRAGRRWKWSSLIAYALNAKSFTVAEAIDAERREADELSAEFTANFAAIAFEAGSTSAAERAFAESERLLPGPALAHRLVLEGRTDLEGAIRHARSAATDTAHPQVWTALARLLIQKGELPEAKSWAKRALTRATYNRKALELLAEICRQEGDVVCMVDARGRANLPTFLTEEEREELERKWISRARDQAKRRVTQSAAELNSSGKPIPKTISVKAVGHDGMMEFLGLPGLLQRTYPGITFNIGELDPAPVPAWRPDGSGVSWTEFFEHVKPEPGTIYAIDVDLTSGPGTYALERIDLEQQVALVSVTRTRSPFGEPTTAGEAFRHDTIHLLEARGIHLLVSAVGRLLGLTKPCHNPRCPLAEKTTVLDYAVLDLSLCTEHFTQLYDRRQAAP